MPIVLRFRSAVLLLLLLSGCGSLFDPSDRVRYERRPGTLAFYSDPVQVTVPDSVSAGNRFSVRVTTYGGGCSKQGPTDVKTNGLLAVVRPFDYDVAANSNVICPSILTFYKREAVVTFARPGAATVRIYGRQEPGEDPLVVERTVIVTASNP